MFLNLITLNEGGIIANPIENRRQELREGENPKTSFNSNNWQTSNTRSHVNLNWQKLRK